MRRREMKPMTRGIQQLRMQVAAISLVNGVHRQYGWPKLSSRVWPMQINVTQMGCQSSMLLIKPFGFLSRRHTFFFDNPSFHRLPRFFLWDPAVLCLNGIPCPRCQHRRTATAISPSQDGVWISRQTFWMIGYRYHCHDCTNPRTGKRTITFRSRDSRILGAIILKWMQSRSITFWLRCRAPEKQSFPSRARSFSSTHDHRSSVQSGMCAKLEEGC